MGTPHLGADAAKWAKFLTGFTKVFLSTAEPLVAVLKRDSEVLANLTHGFNEMLETRQKERKREIKITCFFEEVAMGKGPVTHTVSRSLFETFLQSKLTWPNQIVPKDSAIISGKPHFSIHANHVNMTKFSERTDGYYELVEYQIERVADMDAPPSPTAAEAARNAWGTTQGNNNITNSALESRGDMNIGNFNTQGRS
jgi:hypothetical protein